MMVDIFLVTKYYNQNVKKCTDILRINSLVAHSDDMTYIEVTLRYNYDI